MSEIEVEVVRPSFVKNKHLVFLDELRKSGVTNMFGSAPYVQAAFRMPREKASATVAYWIQTFEQRHPELRRTK